jgi:hypothetical protein
MSQRSQHSVSASIASTLTPTPDRTYKYALRVAYLVHLLQPRPEPSPPAAPEKPSRLSSGTDGWTNALTSLGDAFKDVGASSKSARVPEKLIKVLGAK